MPKETIYAMLVMLLTLAVYTLTVYFLQRRKSLYAVLLWLGFVSNSLGFGLIAGFDSGAGGAVATLCRVCSIAAIVIIMVHAIWATAVLVLKEEKSARILLRDGPLLWKIWLVPFLLGMLLYIVRW